MTRNITPDDLSHMSPGEIDALPFGYIALSPEGVIRKYNRYEADLARKDPKDVLGKNFFRDVAPCTQVREFEGRFRELVEDDLSTLSFDFDFKFRHGTQNVRIGFVRSPLDKEVIVTVNRLQDLALDESDRLERDATRGTLRTAAGKPVVLLGADFFHSLDLCSDTGTGGDRRTRLHRLGYEWGKRHAARADRRIQERYARTLREVEMHLALETLSGSLGPVGLGRFDVSFDHQDKGLLVIHHQASPWARMPAAREGFQCALLGGLHAGFLSYLSGQDLTGWEIACGRSADQPCRFLVARRARLEKLFIARDDSDDSNLLSRLTGSPEPVAGPTLVRHG